MRAIRVAVSAEWRASGRQQAKDAVGIDTRRVDGERHQHDDDPKREHAALGERLGADVGRTQERQPEPVEDDRVAALSDEAVDRDDEDAQRQAPARRGAKRVPGLGSDPGDHHARAGPGQHDRVRVEKRDHGERSEIDAGRDRACVAERRAARNVGERRSHSPAPLASGSATARSPGRAATA